MVNKRNKRKKEPAILAIFAVAMIIFSSTATIITAPDEEENLGMPFQYPDLPRKEATPNYFLVKEPAITMEGTKATIEFQTIVPAPKARVDFGLYLPDQEIKVPQYRFSVVEDLEGESTNHMVKLDLAKFERDKYDVSDFAENGGVIAYRIELYHPKKASVVFYDWRFRIDGDYDLIPCITEGPFVDMITTSGAVISWEANEASTGEVVIDGRVFTDNVVSVRHEIPITGLVPEKEYPYDVFAGGIADFKTYHLKTVPVNGSKFQFAVMSDSREGVGGGENNYGGMNYRIAAQFLRDAYLSGAEFILFGGDLVNGYTTSPEDFSMQLSAWKDAAEQVGAYIPIYEGMGNHESLMELYDDGSPYGIEFDTRDYGGSKSAETVFAEEFVNPQGSYPDPEDETAPSYRENVYYFDYGNSRIISFNTNYWWCSDPENYGGNLEGYVMDNQLQWIREVLEDAQNDSSIEHIFLFGHEPAFPNGGHLKDAQWYGGKKDYVVERRDELWEAISENGKVVAAFFGDEHNYNRMFLDKNTPVYLDGSSNPGFTHPVWQIISGGVGAPYYSRQETPWSDYVDLFYPGKNYCFINVDGGEVTLTVKSDSGEIVDEAVLKIAL